MSRRSPLPPNPGSYRLTLYLDAEDLAQHWTLRDLSDDDLSEALRRIFRGVRTVEATKATHRRAIEIRIKGQP